MRQALRPYQERAIQEVRAALSHGKRRVLLVSPTGSGKTTIASEVIHSAVALGSRSLFLAHRRELIDQCSRRLDEWGVDHGVIQAGHWRWAPQLQVQVACVPTLVNRLASGAIAPDAKLIIVDECHRSTSPSYTQIIQAHPGAAVLGLTATPIRQNGKGLGTLYDHLVLVAQPSELVDEGFLIEPTIFSGEQIDVSGVTVRNGEYVEAELAAAADKPKLVGNVLECWAQHVGRGRRTVLFASGVDHSKHLVETFVAAGIPAAHIDGETPLDERDSALRRLREGELEVVSNVAVLTEGWDLPLLDAVSLVRPTRSLGLYLQCVGRVLRPAPGKAQALVLDHGGNVMRHGWPTSPRTWALDDRASPRADLAADAVKNCPKCGRCVRAIATACPCGFVWTVAPRKPPEHEEGELRAVDRKSVEESRALRLNALAKYVAVAKTKGMQLGPTGFPAWAGHRFRERFGAWPSVAEMIEALARTRSVRARAELVADAAEELVAAEEGFGR